MTDSQTFAALAREETELDATSAENSHISRLPRSGERNGDQIIANGEDVCYMLCRSFGVSCEKPDATKLGVLYEGMEPQDARGILDSIQGIFREMQGAVQNEVAPQQEQKRAYNHPAR